MLAPAKLHLGLPYFAVPPQKEVNIARLQQGSQLREAAAKSNMSYSPNL